MKSPEKILDENQVRIAGSMQNRILLSMAEYAIQEVFNERDKLKKHLIDEIDKLEITTNVNDDKGIGKVIAYSEVLDIIYKIN